MSLKNKSGSALILGIALSLTACDSAIITGNALEIGAAQSPSLLQDGDFEIGAATWESCSTAGTSELSNDASEGELALGIDNGACRYQNSPAIAGISYRLSCDTKQITDGWAGLTLAFLDQDDNPLESREVAINTADYSQSSIILTAPDFTANSEVLIYSEGSANVDNCRLTEETVSIPAVSLDNGTFDDGLAAWSQCSATDATTNAGLAVVAGGACINQTVDVADAVAASPANDPLTLTFRCDQIAVNGNQYAAAIIAFLDADNSPVANAETTLVTSSDAQVTLSAPGDAESVEVMIYSEAQTNVGQCQLQR